MASTRRARTRTRLGEQPELDAHRAELAALLERVLGVVTGEAPVDPSDLFGRRIETALNTLEFERSVSSDLSTTFRADRERRSLSATLGTMVEMVLQDVWQRPRPPESEG